MKEKDLEEAVHPGFRDRFNDALNEYTQAAELKITQESVGELFSVTGVGARHWMQGEKLPGMANAVKISGILGVCVEWLLTGRGQKRPSAGGDGYLEELNAAYLDFSTTERTETLGYIAFLYSKRNDHAKRKHFTKLANELESGVVPPDFYHPK